MTVIWGRGLCPHWTFKEARGFLAEGWEEGAGGVPLWQRVYQAVLLPQEGRPGQEVDSDGLEEGKVLGTLPGPPDPSLSYLLHQT